tara:strand:- start:410 stop:1750 length:1341 start_codon:yes stop_codon:yes gene_type:complete
MSVKKINGITKANVKKLNTIAKASVKNFETIGMAQHASIGAFTSVGEAGYRPVVCYDTTNDRIIAVWQAVSNNYLRSAVGTVTDAGAISWGTIMSVNEDSSKPLAISFNQRDGKAYLMYNDASNSKTYLTRGTVTTGSPDTISYSTRVEHYDALTNNANSTYTTVRNSGEVVFTRYTDSDTNNERKDFIFFSDDSVANVSLDFDNDQTPDAQDHGITWANLHSGTNAKDLVIHAGRNSPSGDTIGQLAAYSMNSGNNSTTHGGFTNLTGEDGFENYQVAWDEKIGKGLIVAQGNAAGVTSAGYFWSFSIDDSDNSITVNHDTNESGYITSATDSHYGINVMYNYDAGHFVVMYVFEDDVRGRSATLNASDDTVSWGTEFTAYQGSSSNGAQNPPTNVSPDRVDMDYLPDGSKGIIFACRREVSGTSTPHVGRLSAFGTTDYSQAAG